MTNLGLGNSGHIGNTSSLASYYERASALRKPILRQAVQHIVSIAQLKFSLEPTTSRTIQNYVENSIHSGVISSFEKLKALFENEALIKVSSLIV
jgi:hypothetical protein